MKQFILYIVLIAIVSMLNTCSINIAGGATSETTNGIVSATIVHEGGTPAVHIPVFLMPLSYNPVKDTPIPDYLSDTTDENGNANFIIVKNGSFNLLATHPAALTRSFRPAIEVKSDTIVIYDTLREAGAAKIELPDTVDTITSYLYIPGTDRYQKLSEEVLIYVDNTIHIVFDSIPAGNIPGIYFGKEDTLFNAIPLTDAFLVTSGDTVNITTHVEWLAYTTANSGLPSDNIIGVITDDAGMLWVGTDMNGLATFDGTDWAVYTTQNSPLPNNIIRAIAKGPDGTLWVGTTGGLVSIKNTTWQAYTTANSGLPFNYITAVAVDSAGHKWLGTINGCVEFDGTNWNHYTGPSDVSIVVVNSIAVDRQGLVMIGTDDGLFTYDKTQWEYIQVSADETSYNSIQDIAVDQDNVAWLATSKGLASYSEGACTIHDGPDLDFSTSKLKSIAVDWNNIVWLGTLYEGNIVKYSNPVVSYNDINTDVLEGVICINDIDADTQDMISFATKYSGVIIVQFTSAY